MSLVSRVVAWIREGYPSGVPGSDYQPLLALLRRQLTPEEVEEIARVLTPASQLEDPPIDAGVEITKKTDGLPSEDEILRVLERLDPELPAALHWPRPSH